MGELPRHPIQPLHDVDGVTRFRANEIVRYLLDHNGGKKIDLNSLAYHGFSVDDWEQFAQLIGYSLSGFSELSYARDETVAAADAMVNRGVTEQEARIDYFRETIRAVREGLRITVPAVFQIHPDDLKEIGDVQ